MPIQHVKNEYLIPRGRVYFDPYDANEQLTGEIALGNCPGVNISISTEKKDHFSSETGLRQKDASWLLQVDRTGKLSCDNFSPSNAALWLAGTVERKTQVATPVTGELRDVLPGRQYHLGATAANPMGVRNVTAITVKSENGTTTYVAGTDYNVDTETGRVQIIEGGAITAKTKVQFGYTPVAGSFDSVKSGGTTTYVAGTDYNVDTETGRVQIIEGGAITAKTKVQFGYTPVAASFDSVKSGGKAELTGALRVVSDNAAGGNRDWYLPKVTLAPEGDLALIAEGDDVVTMEFSLEALKPANGEAIYCDGRPVAVP